MVRTAGFSTVSGYGRCTRPAGIGQFKGTDPLWLPAAVTSLSPGCQVPGHGLTNSYRADGLVSYEYRVTITAAC
jgi:hypothetical protein